jgi:hypothetical protein
MHNEQSSARTSPSEPRHRIELSEAEFLAREVQDAKAALAHAVADLKSGLTSSADLRLWVKHYPWAALGAATVAGFAAAATITPAPGESVSDKLSRLRSNGSNGTAEESANHPAERAKQRSTVKASLIDSLFDLAKTLIQTVFLATLQSRAAGHPQSESTTSPATGNPWPTRMG